jgi:hypothetical protein
MRVLALSTKSLDDPQAMLQPSPSCERYKVDSDPRCRTFRKVGAIQLAFTHSHYAFSHLSAFLLVRCSRELDAELELPQSF